MLAMEVDCVAEECSCVESVMMCFDDLTAGEEHGGIDAMGWCRTTDLTDGIKNPSCGALARVMSAVPVDDGGAWAGAALVLVSG